MNSLEESPSILKQFTAKAAGADYWRIVNSYQGEFSYNTLKEEDARYVDFKAYKEKGVIYCNMREKPFL